MARTKQPEKKRGAARDKSARRESGSRPSVDKAVRTISKLIKEAKKRGAFDGRKRARGFVKKPSAASNPGAPFARVIAGAKTEDQQLRALEAAATQEVALPADAFVIGEPVEVVSIDYSGHPRAGLTTYCRTGGGVYKLALPDIAFLPGSDGARFVSMYRAWLGLGELSLERLIKGPTPVRRDKTSAQDMVVGELIELIVLSCTPNALRCRMLGTARELTLRIAAPDEVPGEIITVLPTKYWTHAGHSYLSGSVQSSRADVLALELIPLALHEQGEWDPDHEYWGEEGEPIEDWAKPIVARGKRRMFELEQVIPGVDADDFDVDNDPILEASELNAAGEHAKARALLMDLLAKDLRCLDAHAHLGNMEFDHRPERARRHYEVGMTIGAFTLGKRFDGVLPWGLIDNRPFLRCMHGLGICFWRIGKAREAAAVFRRMLGLNPSDNQGARFNLAAVEAGRAWEEAEEAGE